MMRFEYERNDLFNSFSDYQYKKKGATVKVIEVKKGKDPTGIRKQLVGKIAKIKEVRMKTSLGIREICYVLEFEEQNNALNTLMKNVEWKNEEICLHGKVVDKLKNQIIINYPAIICIMKNLEGEQFKGVAKCLPEDSFCIHKGIEIALLKSQKKFIDKRLKKITK